MDEATTSEVQFGHFEEADLALHIPDDVLPERGLNSSADSTRSVRKRYLLFGRSNKRTSSRTPAFSPAGVITPERPSTALSSNSATSRRSKLEPWETLRSSIFGTRKPRSPDDGPTLRPSSRSDVRPLTSDADAPEQFRTANEYYRHLRLRSISRPMEFQHLAHTPKSQALALERVDEAEVKEQFAPHQCSHEPLVDAQSRDQKRLNRKKSITDAPLILSRPISPMFFEFSDMSDQVSYAHQPVEPSGELNALEFVFPPVKTNDWNQTAPFHTEESSPQHGRQQADGLTDMEPARASRATNCGGEKDVSANQLPNQDVRIPQAYDLDVPSCEGEADLDAGHAASEVSTESECPPRVDKPLPDLPQEKTEGNMGGTDSLRVSSTATLSSVSFDHPSGRESWAFSSKHSSQISASARQSAGKSTNNSDQGQTSDFTDATWEDDVDFCYQQEAESTCEFDWDFPVAGKKQPNQGDGSLNEIGLGSIAAPKLLPMANPAVGTYAHIPGSQKPSQHSRGSSVGHRGFSAARSTLADHRSKMGGAPSPAPLNTSSMTPAHGSHPSGGDARDRDPLKEAIESPLTPGPLHRSHYTADPFRPDHSRQNTGASASSSPGSLTAIRHHRNGSSITKASISLPMSVADSNDSGSPESAFVPREMQTLPMRSTFMIRRPETSEDRALLQAAGRASQRERGPTVHHLQQGIAYTPGNLRTAAGVGQSAWI